jgi:hypothetical protein
MLSPEVGGPSASTLVLDQRVDVAGDSTKEPSIVEHPMAHSS